jgi:hypothetical protein
MTLSVWPPALARWDLSGSSSLRATWAENVDYSESRSLKRDPADPNNFILVESDPDGDALTDVRLSGGAEYTGARSRFRGTYSPSGAFYRDRTDLNRFSHTGRVRAEWDLTRRSLFSVSDAFVYTPEQGARSDTVQSPVVITDFSDRRSNVLTINYRVEVSEVSTLTAGARQSFQSFSDPDLADFTGVGANLRWSRNLSLRSGLEFNGAVASNRFRERVADPNTLQTVTARTRNKSVTLNSGGHVGLGNRFMARALLGYSLINPEQSGRSNKRGTHTQAAIRWLGSRVEAETGYSRRLSTGSGTFSVSWTETYFTGVTARFTQKLTGNLFVNRSYSRGADTNRDDEVATTSGGASVNFALAGHVSGTAAFSRNVQDSDEDEASNLGFNRYSVGLVAAFN